MSSLCLTSHQPVVPICDNSLKGRIESAYAGGEIVPVVEIIFHGVIVGKPVLIILQGSVQRLEASGNEGNQALANRCKLDLAKQGFNVPAVPGTDEIQAGQ